MRRFRLKQRWRREGAQRRRATTRCDAQEKDLPAYMYGDLKREELVRSGSVVLHELYFANLGGDPKPSGKVLDIIKQWFGSYEQWEDEFKKPRTLWVADRVG